MPIAGESPPGAAARLQERTAKHRKPHGEIESEEAGIPQRPTAPPPLLPNPPHDGFQCQRYFVYEGKRLPCDSYLGRDAEALRPIVSDTPAALAELDTYQLNRQKMYNTAYFGSVGLAMFIAANFFFTDGTLHTIGFYGGTGIIAASGIYGLNLIRTNNTHLGKAVEYHNIAHPEHAIELEFSTGSLF